MATLYLSDSGSHTTSDLHTVDPTTAALLTDIGPIGDTLVALAGDSQGNAFGVTNHHSGANPHSFGSVNLATGAFTFIHDYGGSTGNGFVQNPENFTGICFDANDVLWGIRQDGNLCTIDPSTGIETVVGDTGLSGLDGGLAFGLDGTLFLDGADDLYTLDTSTAAPTHIGNHFPDIIQSLATDPDTGIVYGAHTQNGQLFTVDTSTGATTLIGYTNTNPSTYGGVIYPGGLAFIAPLSSPGIHFWIP